MTGSTDAAVRDQLITTIGSRQLLNLELDWDPVKFVEEQYDSLYSFDLANVICISGRNDYMHATTCSKYVNLVWPNLGWGVVQSINDAIKKAPDMLKGKATISYGHHIHC